METLTHPPGFDPEKACQCGTEICSAGNQSVPVERRQCMYWEKTEPGNNGVSAEVLATDPGWS